MPKIKLTVQDRQVFGCIAKARGEDLSLKEQMSDVVDRTALQDAIFEKLIVPEDEYAYIYSQFWINTHNKQSLRLTKRGFVLLSKTLGLTYYTNVFRGKSGVEIARSLAQGGTLLRLDHAMTCPYYINDWYRLELFGEKEQMWLTMYDGDILKFLDSWT